MMSRTVLTLLFSRRAVLLALCLPASWSLIACCGDVKPRMLVETPTVPGLAFDQYYVNLREVTPSEEVFAYFSFQNVGDVPLRIDKLVPSCGCLLPQMKKKDYLPGEKGEFLLRIRTTAQMPGPKEFIVTAHYTDIKARTRDVMLRAVFPEEQIYARPMSLSVHQLGTSPVEQEVVVTDLRNSPASILGVSASSDLVQVAVLEPTKSTTGAKIQRIRVSVPGPIASGRHSVLIKIYTNDPKFSEIKVPMQIFGPDKNPSKSRIAGPLPLGPYRG